MFVLWEQIKGQKLCYKIRAQSFSTLYKTPSILTNESKTLKESCTYTHSSFCTYFLPKQFSQVTRTSSETYHQRDNETSKQRYRSVGVFNRRFTTSRSFLIERFHDWRSKRSTNDRREWLAKLFTTDTSDTRDSNRSTTDRHSFSRVLHYLCAVVFNHGWTYNISARHFK